MKNFRENCEIIAEVANAHCGDFFKLKELIKIVSKCGARNIKFQIFDPPKLLTRSHPDYDLLSSFCFDKNQWIEVGKLCEDYNLNVYCDIFDETSLVISKCLNPIGIKIHSTNIDDHDFLRIIANATNKVILSTGGSFYNEIKDAVDIIIEANKEVDLILMSGIQNFPTSLSDTHLRRIFGMQEAFNDYKNIKYGLQDHISGDDKMSFIVPFMARLMNYSLIEKHITIERADKEIDYYSSLNPKDFKILINEWGKVSEIMGSSSIPINNLSEEEKKYRRFSKKYAIANTNIKAGKKVSIKDLTFKRISPQDSGLTRKEVYNAFSLTVKNPIKRGEIIQNEHFE